MAPKLTFKYDREADILRIDKCQPYAEQESEELDDEVIARLNPRTGEVENVEVLFFSTRLLRNDLFELPLSADLRLPVRDYSSRGEEEIMTLDRAKELFLGLLRSLEPMKANPWPFLCASALVEYLTKMVNGGRSGAQEYKQFVETYLARVDQRYKTFKYTGGQQDLPAQMYHVLRCGIVHSFSLIPDAATTAHGGRLRSIVIAHEGSHLSNYTEKGLDAALLVLHDFVIDLEKVLKRIFVAAKEDSSLRANIETHLLEHPPIQALSVGSAANGPVPSAVKPVSGSPI